MTREDFEAVREMALIAPARRTTPCRAASRHWRHGWAARPRRHRPRRSRQERPSAARPKAAASRKGRRGRQAPRRRVEGPGEASLGLTVRPRTSRLWMAATRDCRDARIFDLSPDRWMALRLSIHPGFRLRSRLV